MLARPARTSSTQLYVYAWFTGFGLAFGLYLLLMKAMARQPAPQSTPAA